jgi:serine/threonine protein phosphatase PrpC
MPSTIRVECYGASRSQQGRTHNEDAYLIGRVDRPFAALADGAGNAERAAKKALTLFEKLLGESSLEEIEAAEIWARWVRLLDSALLGSSQSTFIAVGIIGNQAIGACAGDSRAYHVNREGCCRILTDGAAKHRLGSGQARAFPLRVTLEPREILLLLSDGAWTPLSLQTLQKTVVTVAVRHFSEIPVAILDAAGRNGRADDMTAIALRLTG